MALTSAEQRSLRKHISKEIERRALLEKEMWRWSR